MSSPTGDNVFLHDLELNVRAELTLAETGPSEEEAVDVPIDEWLSDPADDQRYEVALHSLLGAVEVLEDGSGSGGHPLLAEAPNVDETAPYVPDGRHRHTETEGW